MRTFGCEKNVFDVLIFCVIPLSQEPGVWGKIGRLTNKPTQSANCLEDSAEWRTLEVPQFPNIKWPESGVKGALARGLKRVKKIRVSVKVIV